MAASIKSLFLLLFLLAIIVELIWANGQKKAIYNWKDVVSNFVIVLGGKIIKPLSILWMIVLFEPLEAYQIIDIPNNWMTFILAFFLSELVYYWYHRISHSGFLWTIHHTHHSSPWFNFTTAGRLNWLGKFTSPIFYIPLILIGFSANMIGLCLGISLVYQIFIHTEMVGKLGLFEGLFFNTPSAHRVHHASDQHYIDKNFGGTLIIFDRLFGTYTSETTPVTYGVTEGFTSHNPLKIIFFPIWNYLKKKLFLRTFFLFLIGLLCTNMVFSQNDTSLKKKAVVYVFIHESCIISQHYTKKLNELNTEFQSSGIQFIGVFPFPKTNPAALLEFKDKYNISFELVIDKDLKLTNQFNVTITPEVIVWSIDQQKIIYQGRIDNTYARVGKKRNHTTSFELKENLNAFQQGISLPHQNQPAIGCIISK